MLPSSILLAGSVTAQHYARQPAKYRTDILSQRVVNELVVILNTHQLIKEAFVKRSEFADGLEVNLFNPEHAGECIYIKPRLSRIQVGRQNHPSYA